MTLPCNDEFFEVIVTVLKELQQTEDRPYNVREIGEVIYDRHVELKAVPIVNLTKRIGTMLVARARKPENNLEKTRARISNNIGGNYLYYLKSA
jgi:hypothetical protein